jgi:hypothetical protein
MDYATLHETIQEDVESQLPQQKFGAAFPGISPRTLIPGLVKLALDAVVDYTGVAVESLAAVERDAIRSVVSDKVLKFVEGLAHGLESQP